MNIERITKVKNSKPFTVLDIVVVIIIAAAIVLSALLLFRKPAVSVEISEDGRVRTVALDGAAPVTIELTHLTVHIQDGKVWVTDADCPDKVCEHTGAICRAGQQIVCLPNAVVITLVGEGGLHGVLG